MGRVQLERGEEGGVGRNAHGWWADWRREWNGARVGVYGHIQEGGAVQPERIRFRHGDKVGKFLLHMDTTDVLAAGVVHGWVRGATDPSVPDAIEHPTGSARGVLA